MAAAEDIYMEAIIQYWEKRKELPADTNIPGYILTTVKNKSLNHLRHQTIRTDVEDQLYDHRQRELNFVSRPWSRATRQTSSRSKSKRSSEKH